MSGGMTLGDLLSRPEYHEVHQFSGGPEALYRPLHGIHSTEYEHPAEWVEPGWVILTLGFRLRRNPEAQRALVVELDEAGVTALGLGLGSAFKAPPKAMLAEARTRGFPVFTIPLTTSFRDMIRDVYQALLSDDLRGYQRLVSMQHHLLDAFDDRHPEETVLIRLASLVQATAAVLGPGGQVERATGPVAGETIWPEIASRPQTVMEFEVGGSQVAAVPITRTTPARWLVAVSRSGPHRSPTTKHALRITAPLLSAMSRLNETARAQELEIKASLLAELAQPSTKVDLPGLLSRAAVVGIDFTAPVTVARFAVRSPEKAADELPASLATALQSLAIPHLVRAERAGALALIQADARVCEEALSSCLAAVARLGAVMAIGRPVKEPAEIAASAADAALCLAQLLRTNGGRVLRYQELDLDAMMLSEVPYERVEGKIAEILGALEEQPRLRETLEAYFEHDLDVAKTAAALFLAPNSMRYRLRRIEELLGRSLRSPATISVLHMALMSDQRSTPGPSAPG
jgi:purine catabolism regulator